MGPGCGPGPGRGPGVRPALLRLTTAERSDPPRRPRRAPSAVLHHPARLLGGFHLRSGLRAAAVRGGPDPDPGLGSAGTGSLTTTGEYVPPVLTRAAPNHHAASGSPASIRASRATTSHPGSTLRMHGSSLVGWGRSPRTAAAPAQPVAVIRTRFGSGTLSTNSVSRLTWSHPYRRFQWLRAQRRPLCPARPRTCHLCAIMRPVA